MATETKKKMSPTDVVTPEFRASYPTLFEARPPDVTKPNENLQYGVEMWFRVKDTEESLKAGEKVVSIEALQKAATAALIDKFGPDKAAWPKGLKHPFKKGEENTGKNGPVPGVIMVRTARKVSFDKPVVVDQDLKPIMDKKQIYAGCYCRAKIHAYAWKHPVGGAGVSFTLDMVQLVRDGEPLGNRQSPEDAFEPLAMPAAAAKAEATAAADTFGDLS